ncbi:GGDEF domain-containing protein [Bacillus sp. 1P02SD]|uniref:GGDEF domain-containing protein n=1 Tax=Bacillus sp. 1P02SD TaxID=3132264 RepID=UPI0039A0BDC3
MSLRKERELPMLYILFIGMPVFIIIGYTLWNKVRNRMKYLKTIAELVENSKDIIYYCEIKPVFKYRYLSPAINKILSPTLVSDSMKNPYTAYQLIHPDDYHILEKKALGELDFSKPFIQRWRNEEGIYISFEEYATPIYNKDGELIAMQGIIRNINDKVILKQQLEYKVTHDSLTGIYNREYFEAQVEHYDKNEDVPIAIIICDLDELKYVNDTFGHKNGDNLIKETANLLKKVLDRNIVVSRIGGDEFSIMILNTNPLQVEAILEGLELEIDRFNRSTNKFNIKLSKGHAFYHSSIGKMEELFTKADNKMYEDKNQRKKQLAISR